MVNYTLEDLKKVTKLVANQYGISVVCMIPYEMDWCGGVSQWNVQFSLARACETFMFTMFVVECWNLYSQHAMTVLFMLHNLQCCTALLTACDTI